MYRQIMIQPRDRDMQRILWRINSDGQMQEYQLNTVTYWLTCAPFLAIRTLHQLATDKGQAFPNAAATLRSETYVDDSPGQTPSTKP